MIQCFHWNTFISGRKHHKKKNRRKKIHRAWTDALPSMDFCAQHSIWMECLRALALLHLDRRQSVRISLRYNIFQQIMLLNQITREQFIAIWIALTCEWHIRRNSILSGVSSSGTRKIAHRNVRKLHTSKCSIDLCCISSSKLTHWSVGNKIQTKTMRF